MCWGGGGGGGVGGVGGGGCLVAARNLYVCLNELCVVDIFL